MSRPRRFQWTSYDVSCAERVRKLVGHELNYACWGIETCPTTGRTHVQGYAEQVKQLGLKKLQELWGDKFHMEEAKGTAKQNATYCSKDGDFHEYGTPKQQGKRSDITDIRAAVQAGESLTRVVERCTNYQSIRIAEKLYQYSTRRRDWPVEVYWYYGDTGTGKTRTAFEEASEEVWISGRNLKWWDGYENQEDVIVDDFRGDFCTFHELLRILDRYPMRVEVKGSSRELLAKRVWITSAYPPWEVYSSREDIGQLLRRCTKVKHFCAEDNEGPTEVPRGDWHTMEDEYDT